MPEIQEALAKYVQALEKGSAATQNANDRPLFLGHLAAAAGMFADLHRGDMTALARRVVEERRSFGWSFLAGDSGAAAEKAFDEFAKSVEAL